ncbi:ABC transporter [Krasilnikovia sp. M28-CT-15]|uniref:ABC transporter n=1 Tax=Krasilnikovia sp. M28-CT-15 TaxID=3373540 RepID=UPI00399CB43F
MSDAAGPQPPTEPAPDAAGLDDAPLPDSPPRDAPPSDSQPRDAQPRDVQPRDAQPSGTQPAEGGDQPAELGDAQPGDRAGGDAQPAAGDNTAPTTPAAAEPPAAVRRLATALTQLRKTLESTAYPLVMPSADEAGRVRAALVSQLDDYLLPRLTRLDAPLLVVVGGSTGAGKSTLVNSLVRAPVSPAGVLRPTTRSPVLVSHSADLAWFRQGELLPGLTRTAESTSDPGALQLVAAPALGAGLALLDAPDIDSVVDRNRALAAQLLAAADLWLFVTTAARYADAVPWELLTTARLRGTVIALVLDRVPDEAAGEVSAHLREMLAAHDMAAAPLFVLPETSLDGQGLLAEDVVRPLRDWFAQLAADATARATVVRQTLDGALAALRPAVEGLAAAADEQAAAAVSLDERVAAAYRTARRAVEDGLRDGRLLRGEVLARWQEFLGTGEFLRSLESRVGQLRDRIVSAVTGRPAPGQNLQMALESQLVTLLRGLAADAAEQAYAAWQAHPAGVALLAPELQQPSPDLPERAERVIRDWQQSVLDLVRTEGGDKRATARGAAYAVNGAGLAVMVAVFTATAFIPTGLEVAVGAGTTVAAQKVLEALFGDQAIRTLATRARADLLSRVEALLDAEAARYRDRTAATGLDPEPGAALRRAATDVESAREDLALTVPTPAEAGTP